MNATDTLDLIAAELRNKTVIAYTRLRPIEAERFAVIYRDFGRTFSAVLDADAHTITHITELPAKDVNNPMAQSNRLDELAFADRRNADRLEARR